jgi:hypothetical protein
MQISGLRLNEQVQLYDEVLGLGETETRICTMATHRRGKNEDMR